MNVFVRISRATLGPAIAIAAWAALPAVQWCPLDWRQVPLERLLRCADVAATPDAGCRPPEPVAADACGAGCPLAGDAQPAAPAACPLAHGPARPEPTPNTRAFCVAGPNGGAGLRAAAPSFDPSSQPVTEVAALAELERPALATLPAPVERVARPPTATPHRLPSPRAPPAEC